jgi:hypothetical protein
MTYININLSEMKIELSKSAEEIRRHILSQGGDLFQPDLEKHFLKIKPHLQKSTIRQFVSIYVRELVNKNFLKSKGVKANRLTIIK